MSIQLFGPLGVAIVGALLYLLLTSPKWSRVAELGKILFFVGSFWVVHALSGPGHIAFSLGR